MGGPKGGGGGPEGWGARSGGSMGGGPKGGPEGWGPKGGDPKGGGPKISRVFLSPDPFSFFFSLSGNLLVSFFSLWMSSRVFFPFFGGLLVEFWWCFGRSGPLMWPGLVGRSGGRAVRRRAVRRRAVRRRALGRSGGGRSGGGRSGGPAEGGPPDKKTAQIGQFKVVAKIGLAVAKSAWSWPKKVVAKEGRGQRSGQSRPGQSRSEPTLERQERLERFSRPLLDVFRVHCGALKQHLVLEDAREGRALTCVCLKWILEIGIRGLGHSVCATWRHDVPVTGTVVPNRRLFATGCEEKLIFT